MSGNSLLFTDGPKDMIKDVEQPIVIVAASYNPVPPPGEGRDQFARAALSSTQSLTDVAIERSQGFRLNGQDWHEIVARAKDAPSGQDVVVMQTIRFAPAVTVRMVGLTRSETRDQDLARFRAVVDTFRSIEGNPSRAPPRIRRSASAPPMRSSRRSRRRRLGPALGNADKRRTQHAVADHVAGLHHLDHRPVRDVGVWHLEHGLMQVRVEFLALRIEFLHAVALERFQEIALGQVDAVDQALERALRPLGRPRRARSGWRGGRCRPR